MRPRRFFLALALLFALLFLPTDESQPRAEEGGGEDKKDAPLPTPDEVSNIGWIRDAYSVLWEVAQADPQVEKWVKDQQAATRERLEPFVKYSYGMNPYDFFLYSTTDYKKELAFDALFIGTKDVVESVFGKGFMARFFKMRIFIHLGTFQRLLELKKGDEDKINEIIATQMRADFHEEMKELLKRPISKKGKTVFRHSSEETESIYTRSYEESYSLQGEAFSAPGIRGAAVSERSQRVERERLYAKTIRESKEIVEEEDPEYKEWSLTFLYDKLFVERTAAHVIADLKTLADQCDRMEADKRSEADRLQKRNEELAGRVGGELSGLDGRIAELSKPQEGDGAAVRAERERQLSAAQVSRERALGRQARVQRSLARVPDIQRDAERFKLFAKHLRNWCEIVTESEPHMKELAQYLEKHRGLLPLNEVPELVGTVDKLKKTTWYERFKDDALKIKEFPEYKDLLKKLSGAKEEKEEEDEKLVTIESASSERFRLDASQRWTRIETRLARLNNLRYAGFRMDKRVREFTLDIRKSRRTKTEIGKIPFKDEWKETMEGVKEWAKKCIKLLDMEGPKLELNPDDPGKETAVGWFVAPGVAYSGWAEAEDDASGINPKEVHLFVTDVATGKTLRIPDVRLFPEEKEEMLLKTVKIMKARIRYRFSVSQPGAWQVWGYVRDRAGHASCDMANFACGMEKDFAKWTGERMLDPDKLLAPAPWLKDNPMIAHPSPVLCMMPTPTVAGRPLDAAAIDLANQTAEWIPSGLVKMRKFTADNAKLLGLDPEKFRRYGFHVVALDMKPDPTPPEFKMLEPNLKDPIDIDPKRAGEPVVFQFEVKDEESGCLRSDLVAWLTTQGGEVLQEWKPEDLEAEMWNGGKKLKPDAGPHARFTRAIAKVSVPRFTRSAVYFLNVQVTNGANLTDGEISPPRAGAAPLPLYIDFRVKPHMAVYQKQQEITITFKAVNAYDPKPVRQVRLEPLGAPPELAPGPDNKALVAGTLRPGESEVMEGTHTYRVMVLPDDPRPTQIPYRMFVEYENGQKREEEVKIPLQLYFEDAELMEKWREQRTFLVATRLVYEDKRKAWRAVPRGTMISVSQIYKYHALGSPKFVEQYVGYGEIANDDGEVRIRIRPQGEPPYRLRIVAKTQCRGERVVGDGKTSRKEYETFTAVLASTVPRPFTLLTKDFPVKDSERNLFKEYAFSIEESDIPFHSRYAQKGEFDYGIRIPWEGELSTGGYISPYGHDAGQNAMSMFGALTGLKDSTNLPDRAMPGLGEQAAMPLLSNLDLFGTNDSNYLMMDTVLIRQNHGGALSILGDLVLAYDFAGRCEIVSDDWKPYEHIRATGIPLVLRREASVEEAEAGDLDLEIRDGDAYVKDPFFRYKEVSRRFDEAWFGTDTEIVYESDTPPPIEDAVEKVRRREEQITEKKEVTVAALLVADTGHDRVVEIEGHGLGTHVIGMEGLSRPSSVERVQDHVYLVCNRGGNEVLLLERGMKTWTFGVDDPKTPESEALASPEYAHDRGGSILIADGGNRRVIEVDRDTRRILWAHDRGLVKPVMATDGADDSVLIVDEGADRVVEVDSEGNEVRVIEGLKAPTSALRLPEGDIVIADSGNRRAIVVDKEGKVVRELKETTRVVRDERGAESVVSRPVKDLQYAFVSGGLLYLVEGDIVVAADDRGREQMKWGKNPDEQEKDEESTLSAPECASIEFNEHTYKRKKIVVIEEPYWEWSRTVKVRRKVQTDVLIEQIEPKELEWKPEPEKLEVKRVAASWSPYGDVPGSLGHDGTVYGTVNGVQRILVRGGDKNPDQDDPHVVLRAYATAFRLNHLHKTIPYGHYAHLDVRATGIQHAWEQGWDHFLPCAILAGAPVGFYPEEEDPKKRKPDEKPFAASRWVDRDIRDQVVKEYDFEGTLKEVREAYAKNPRDLATKYHSVRGLDSGYAWAMLFWHLHSKYGSGFVSHVITYSQTAPGSTPYIDIPTLLGLYPDELPVFEALGLVPKLAMEFPGGKPTTLDTAYPKLTWDVNGLMAYPEMVTFVLELSEDRLTNVVGRYEAYGQSEYDFGKILKPQEMVQKLGSALKKGKAYFWRVLARVESGSETYEVSSPYGAFVISLTEVTIGPSGGTVPIQDGEKSAGSLTLPPDATDEPLAISMLPIDVDPEAADQPIVNGKVFDLDTGGRTFKKAATLTFDYAEAKLGEEEVKGLGIYTFNQGAGTWEYVGGKVDPATKQVSTEIEHTSLYALMVDTRAPRVTALADGPDPARVAEPVTFRFTLDEPARVTLEVVSEGAARTLVRDEPLRAGSHAFDWDGTDEAGRLLPAGVYRWTVHAVDRAGYESRTEPMRILRSDAPRVAIRGRVRAPGGLPARFRAEASDTTLSTAELGEDGVFEIPGAVPGEYEVRIAAEGLFPRRLRGVRVPDAGPLDLGDVELTDRAVTLLGRVPAAFSPDADGRDDTWTLRYDLSTPCAMELDIQGGAPCKTVTSGPQDEGANVIEWKGLGANGRALPNGFYRIQVWARPTEGMEGDRLLQSEHVVLLDNGLLTEAGAFPVVFSPNDDAFDDETSIEAVATHAGLLDAQVLDAEGRLVRELATGLEVKAERVALVWDGRDDKGEVARDGAYTVVVRPSYPGPVASRTVELKVLLDRTPPSLGEISPATSEEVSTGTPKLRARVVSDPADIALATLKVKVDEVTTDPDSYDPETGWIEFTPKTSLGVGNEGVHVVIFYVQDQAGNYADPPVAAAFRVKLPQADRTAPRVEVLAPTAGETVYGDSYSIVARLTDVESGILPDSIVLCVDGKKVASTVRFIIPGKSGKPWDLWQYEKSLILFNPLTGEMRYNAPAPGPGEPPMDGRHTFTLDVEDRAGRIARSVEGNFVLVPDPYPPKVKSIAPANGVTVEEPQPRIAVAFEEQGDSGLDWDTLRFFVDGARIDSAEVRVDEEGTGFRWRPSQELADGADHVLLVDIRDRARNRSGTEMSVFTVRADREPPTVVITSPRAGERRLAGAFDVEASVTDSRRVDPSGIRLELDGEALPFEYDAKTGRLQARVEATLGRHLLVLAATDASGNGGPRVEAAFDVAHDLTPPVVTVEETGAGKVRIRIVDEGAGVDWSSVDLLIDGLPVNLSAPSAGGEVEVSVPPDGDRILVLKVRDRAGNSAEPVVQVLGRR